MFTNERLFTIQAFTITRVHCSSYLPPLDAADASESAIESDDDRAKVYFE